MNKAILDKFGVTEEWIEENSKQYEDGTFELSGPSSPIFYGTPNILQKDEQYIAVPYNNEDIAHITLLAEKQGVEPATIYQQAMKQYLQVT